jgi:hypothetical protein
MPDPHPRRLRSEVLECDLDLPMVAGRQRDGLTG